MSDVQKQFPDSPLSLWLATYGNYQSEPPLQGETEVDIAIIGGGFAGLATAYELLRAEPGLKVAVLEARQVGYGASGRNGSFAMTVIGLGFSTTAMLRGKGYLKDAHTYMERAVDTLDELIVRERLDCDKIRPGFLRVGTTPTFVDKLKHEVDLMTSLGFTGISWIEQDKVQNIIHSERYLGAMWEPRLLLVNPARLVREEKRLAMQMGAMIYENSPVIKVERNGKYTIITPQGMVQAMKVAYTLNAYSHLLPQLRFKQVPAFTYMIATEPLTPKQLDSIGWQDCQGVEDARNLIHYYRITPDHRIVMGGGPVGLTWNNDLHADANAPAWAHLERHLQFLFPQLKNVKITHRWGGPFSVTVNLSPALGYVDDKSAVFSLGCIGHGVSMSHLNSQVLRDMLLERQSDLLDCPFVVKRTIPWPPEPLRSAAVQTIRGYLLAEDRWNERSLPM